MFFYARKLVKVFTHGEVDMNTLLRKQLYTGLILLFLLLLQFKWCTAQNAAIGFRFGSDVGLTLRGNVGKGALEGIIGSGYRPFQVTILYERFQAVKSVTGLHFYYVGGGYVGMFNGRRWYYDERRGYNRRYGYDYAYADPSFGIAGIIGLEYRFAELPLSAGVDLKPFMNIVPWFDGAFDAAFNLRIQL
jgi:hypothetical protein